MKQPDQAKTRSCSSRFIPNRRTSHLHSLDLPIVSAESYSEQGSMHSVLWQDSAYKLLSYSNENHMQESAKPPNLVTSDIYQSFKTYRQVPKKPAKVLDAPSLQDDFYLNLLDWSSSNVLSVGLGSCVYIWNAATSKVSKICDLGGSDLVTSVAWSGGSECLSVGTATGRTLLWDTTTYKVVRTLTGHRGRVGAMAWNASMLSTGSRDRQVLHQDVRSPEQFIARLSGHRQEVCGLKWSADFQQLSTGGNDNALLLWNLHSCTPVHRLTQHTAAVKALAWSPSQFGLLASGGGTADRTVKYWDALTGQLLHSVDTGSQVCNLMFSKTSTELVSTHGYSMNSIVLWNYQTRTRVATLTGHRSRVLYLAMSPDGSSIVTGAGDETVRFWDVFQDFTDTQEPTDRIGLSFEMR